MMTEKTICSKAHRANMTMYSVRLPSTFFVAISIRRLLTHTLTIDTATENVLTEPMVTILPL